MVLQQRGDGPQVITVQDLSFLRRP